MSTSPRLSLALSAHDQIHLASLTQKHATIRDRVRGVAKSYSTGFYLWGDGGLSKSYTVLDELKQQNANYLLHNSRMTGRGLVDALYKFFNIIHVIEDCESIFDDKKAWGVLRSALWSQSRKRPPEREISWTAHKTDIRFVFTGGIILIANKSLDDIPELSALKTRLTTLQLVASFQEIAALMRSVALEGFTYGDDYMTPHECLTVAEFIIDRMRGLGRNLDMRVYVNGVKDFLQHKTGHSSHDWQDLIETRLQERTVVHESRAERIHREEQIAQEIANMPIPQKERAKSWRQRTGKSIMAYYRRLKSLEGT